jgi:oligoendopeptidase F
MSDQYPLNWELDSLYPHPESDDFRATIDQLKSEFSLLADSSETLPIVAADAVTVARWCEFLNRYAAAHAEFSAVNSFVGCHAAADAANKTFQRYEGELSALSPLRSQIATNVEFAFSGR